jgi:hypothetical protein
MSTTFHTPLNNTSTTVASPRSSGVTSLTVADGSVFGSTFPVYATAIRSSTVLTILEITARSGNDLTVSGGADGSADAALQVGDSIQCRDNAGLWSELQTAVNAAETTLTGTLSALSSATPTAIQAYRPANAQTGTTYTLALADDGKLVTLNNGSAITLTVPTNTSVAFPVGAEVDLAQLGAGQVTVSAAGGVTLDSYQSKVAIAGQFAAATLKKLATNTWLLVGNLA